ncbi:MAG: DUF3108 domain-containing protein [Bacteroidetes bacterium]|nr:DUF3108 domain-containing protein [Bacteroidota bacterium]
MDKKKLITTNFAIILLLFPSLLPGQCFTGNNNFGVGEEITYEVTYNIGPIWMEAGKVTFAVIRDNTLAKESWHFKSTGITYPEYDLFFKVRDYFDSWIDPKTFHSYEFRRYTYEGGYTLLNTLHFDYQQNRIISNTKTNNNPQRHDTLAIHPCTFDMLSAVYYARTLNISQLKKDQKIPITLIIDDSIYYIHIRSLGKEIIENRDGNKYRCIKFAARMIQGTIFREDEDVIVWVTDDDNRIPIYIEAKIIVGSVKAFLKSAKGLRNAMTAKVKN